MMHRPVLATAPVLLPVSLAEAKRHLRVDDNSEDALIEGLVRAATEHLDGWAGVLGRCLVEQEWRQDFDRFAHELYLPLGPVISVTTVTWRNAAGQVATVSASNYDLRTDAGGNNCVRFDSDYSFPDDLHESRAVSVTYKAGYETIPEESETPAQSTVPAPIKAAILLLVGHWFSNREAVTVGAATPLPMAVDALIEPYRRVGV